MSQLIPKFNQVILDNFCGQCGNELLAQDNFCRHCGTQAHGPEPTVLATIATEGSQPRSTQSALVSTGHNALRSSTGTIANRKQQSGPAGTVQTVLNNRLYVGIVIALIGPLGLPALWLSPRFSKPTKIVLTAIFVLLTTAVPIAITWYFVDFSMRPLLDAISQ